MRKSAEEKELERIQQEYRNSNEKERIKRYNEEVSRKKTAKIVVYSFIGLIILIIGGLLTTNYFRNITDSWEYRTVTNNDFYVVKSISRTVRSMKTPENLETGASSSSVSTSSSIRVSVINVLDSSEFTLSVYSENFAVGDTVLGKVKWTYKRVPGSDGAYKWDGNLNAEIIPLKELIKKQTISIEDLKSYKSKNQNPIPDFEIEY